MHAVSRAQPEPEQSRSISHVPMTIVVPCQSLLHPTATILETSETVGAGRAKYCHMLRLTVSRYNFILVHVHIGHIHHGTTTQAHQSCMTTTKSNRPRYASTVLPARPLLLLPPHSLVAGTWKALQKPHQTPLTSVANKGTTGHIEGCWQSTRPVVLCVSVCCALCISVTLRSRCRLRRSWAILPLAPSPAYLISSSHSQTPVDGHTMLVPPQPPLPLPWLPLLPVLMPPLLLLLLLPPMLCSTAAHTQSGCSDTGTEPALVVAGGRCWKGAHPIP